MGEEPRHARRGICWRGGLARKVLPAIGIADHPQDDYFISAGALAESFFIHFLAPATPEGFRMYAVITPDVARKSLFVRNAQPFAKMPLALAILPAIAILLPAINPTICSGAENLTISSTAQPYQWQTGGLNSTFAYGDNNGSAPVVVSTSSSVTISPGVTVTITYQSGTVNAGFGPNVNSEGDTADIQNKSPDIDGKIFPSFYIPSTEYPVYYSELVGTFADSGGNIVGSPFPVGLSATETVPTGASQLQLGVNDSQYSDNVGSWNVQVSNSVPEPASLGLMSVGAMALLARRRNCRANASA